MGFAFILLGTVANAAKAASSKYVSKTIDRFQSNLGFNCVRNFLCCIAALAMALLMDRNGILNVTGNEILICTASGIAMAIFTLTWTYAVKGEAYMLVSSFNSANFIIPSIVGIAFLGEKITVSKFISVIFIVFALCLLLAHNFKIKGRVSKKHFLVLILVMISGGISSAMQKIYSVSITDKNVSYYTFYTFLISAVIMLILLIFIKNKALSISALTIANSKHLFVMSIGMFAASYFQSLAAKSIDAVILYPSMNALSLIAGSIMSSLLFKEKITKHCILGVLCVFLALVLSRI